MVTVAELQFGVSKSQHKARNQSALEAFLLPLDIARLSMDTTLVYGEIRADLEKHGRPIGPLNTLIAAHALSLDVPLVTNNSTREFWRASTDCAWKIGHRHDPTRCSRPVGEESVQGCRDQLRPGWKETHFDCSHQPESEWERAQRTGGTCLHASKETD